MMYAVADIATGHILKEGLCPDDHLEIQAGDGEVAIDISALAWTGDERDYHYDGTNVVARVAMPATLSASAAVGASVTLSAPAGAQVTIDGVAQGTIDSSGSEALVFSDAGAYDVRLSLWPYLDFAQQVVVS
jgi:hypothetical protein